MENVWYCFAGCENTYKPHCMISINNSYKWLFLSDHLRTFFFSQCYIWIWRYWSPTIHTPTHSLIIKQNGVWGDKSTASLKPWVCSALISNTKPRGHIQPLTMFHKSIFVAPRVGYWLLYYLFQKRLDIDYFTRKNDKWQQGMTRSAGSIREMIVLLVVC